MTARDLRNIHNTQYIFRYTLPCKAQPKTIPVFLPAEVEASWLKLPSLVSLLSGSTVQPENNATYSCILKVADQVGETQKRISINTNPS